MKRSQRILCLLLAVGVLAGALASPLTAWAKDVTVWDDDDKFDDIKTELTRINLKVGKTADLHQHIRKSVADEDGDLVWNLVGQITWSSGNTEVATVNQDGIVTAKRNGSSVITAIAWDNRGDQHRYTVIVGVSPQSTTDGSYRNSISVPEGKWVDLGILVGNDTGTQWESTNPAVAGVDENGLVEATGIGNCIIKITSPEGSVQRISMQVTAGQINHFASECQLVLSAGTQIELTDLFYPMQKGLKSTTQFVFITSDTAVASIDGTLLKAKEKGVCTVLINQKSGNDQTTDYRLSIIVEG